MNELQASEFTESRDIFCSYFTMVSGHTYVRLGSAQCTTRMDGVPLWFNGILERAVGSTCALGQK